MKKYLLIFSLFLADTTQAVQEPQPQEAQTVVHDIVEMIIEGGAKRIVQENPPQVSQRTSQEKVLYSKHILTHLLPFLDAKTAYRLTTINKAAQEAVLDTLYTVFRLPDTLPAKKNVLFHEVGKLFPSLFEDHAPQSPLRQLSHDLQIVKVLQNHIFQGVIWNFVPRLPREDIVRKMTAFNARVGGSSPVVANFPEHQVVSLAALPFANETHFYTHIEQYKNTLESLFLDNEDVYADNEFPLLLKSLRGAKKVHHLSLRNFPDNSQAKTRVLFSALETQPLKKVTLFGFDLSTAALFLEMYPRLESFAFDASKKAGQEDDQRDYFCQRLSACQNLSKLQFNGEEIWSHFSSKEDVALLCKSMSQCETLVKCILHSILDTQVETVFKALSQYSKVCVGISMPYFQETQMLQTLLTVFLKSPLQEFCCSNVSEGMQVEKETLDIFIKGMEKRTCAKTFSFFDNESRFSPAYLDALVQDKPGWTYTVTTKRTANALSKKITLRVPAKTLSVPQEVSHTTL